MTTRQLLKTLARGKLLVRRVRGNSMLPTFSDGQLVLGIKGAGFSEGSIVFASTPRREVIKRVAAINGNKVTLTGDNQAATNSYVVNSDKLLAVIG